MSGSPTNDDRAERALGAVIAYADNDSIDVLVGADRTQEIESFTCDLLCDLRHLCKREGIDIDALLALSADGFEEECAEEEEAAR
jgi:hypothetical protein